MTRAISLTLVLLAITAALPAAAQESGGLRLRGNPLATLDVIDANRGCPLSSTSVTVGVNKAFGAGSSATQLLGTAAGSIGNGGCRRRGPKFVCGEQDDCDGEGAGHGRSRRARTEESFGGSTGRSGSPGRVDSGGRYRTIGENLILQRYSVKGMRC